MANWPFGKLQTEQASSFRIEFICYIDGYPEPEVVETVEGVFKNLQAAIDEGERLGPSVRRQKRIDGFRVAQGAGPWIAHPLPRRAVVQGMVGGAERGLALSRGRARFTQADVTRAIKAAKQAGVDMTVEIMLEGTIRLVPVAEAAPPAPAPLSPLEQWKAKYGARPA